MQRGFSKKVCFGGKSCCFFLERVKFRENPVGIVAQTLSLVYTKSIIATVSGSSCSTSFYLLWFSSFRKNRVRGKYNTMHIVFWKKNLDSPFYLTYRSWHRLNQIANCGLSFDMSILYLDKILFAVIVSVYFVWQRVSLVCFESLLPLNPMYVLHELHFTPS